MAGLGDYAGTVLAAYGVTFALLGGLVAISVLRAGQVRRLLDRQEKGDTGDGR